MAEKSERQGLSGFSVCRGLGDVLFRRPVDRSTGRLVVGVRQKSPMVQICPDVMCSNIYCRDIKKLTQNGAYGMVHFSEGRICVIWYVPPTAYQAGLLAFKTAPFHCQGFPVWGNGVPSNNQVFNDVVAFGKGILVDCFESQDLLPHRHCRKRINLSWDEQRFLHSIYEWSRHVAGFSYVSTR